MKDASIDFIFILDLSQLFRMVYFVFTIEQVLQTLPETNIKINILHDIACMLRSHLEVTI